MKWLKSGPELKMPDLRGIHPPAFVEDLYYDLKDRRLLPLVALVIVAIVAVPFLLSGESEAPEVHAGLAGGGAATGSGSRSALTVVRAEPGLRDYRKRLHRKPSDPFKQHFTAPQLAGTHLGSGGEEEASTANGTTKTASRSTNTSTTIESSESSVIKRTTREENGVVRAETETSGPTESDSQGGSSQQGQSGSGKGGAGANGGGSGWAAFAVNVRIRVAATLPDGTVEMGDPVTRSRVRAPAAIPGEKTPVVTYLGANLKTGNLVVMVSEEVTSVFGEAKCLMGRQACQLLEVEAGMPTTFVYGQSAKRYKVTFTKLERVPVELPKNLQRAARPTHSGGGGGSASIAHARAIRKP